MATRTLTPEEQAAKDLKEKTIGDFIKEGLKPLEAKAAWEALQQQLKNN